MQYLEYTNTYSINVKGNMKDFEAFVSEGYGAEILKEQYADKKKTCWVTSEL